MAHEADEVQLKDKELKSLETWHGIMIEGELGGGESSLAPSLGPTFVLFVPGPLESS